MQDATTWLITGASSGIGRSLAQQALDAGDEVVGVFRSSEQAEEFAASTPDRSHSVIADVRDTVEIDEAVAAAVAAVGHLDVVVNAAGYAVVGAVEELSDVELLAQLDVNLCGVQRVLRAVLPTMRAAGRGTIVNVSSVAGQLGYPGLGAYDASKAGLELLSEALRAEVAPFGIRVIVVEPGNIRTDWAGRSMVMADTRLAAYDATAGASRDFFHGLDGTQEGDPGMVAVAIRDAVAEPDPPFRLVVGADAHEWIGDALRARSADLSRWRPSR